eukprot:CAMPEP_0197627682 /NCGR_PEP_ID=MMETSP1338-20131121/6226_1 /TAXON_ID=43686 ORGANISM="Pelagodinium beii, Strain RCC1491" /NCGR_SAMPLE_ID=MMETSP1338 /ASSEMBLY_ACC=CAM_ASM_000754 /LENGTH=224 /DNA_ID=CAMNT_0043198469 /DNA_START=301 /DNA_END=977 /DNA_ORIENTATION=+
MTCRTGKGQDLIVALHLHKAARAFLAKQLCWARNRAQLHHYRSLKPSPAGATLPSLPLSGKTSFGDTGVVLCELSAAAAATDVALRACTFAAARLPVAWVAEGASLDLDVPAPEPLAESDPVRQGKSPPHAAAIKPECAQLQQVGDPLKRCNRHVQHYDALSGLPRFLEAHELQQGTCRDVQNFLGDPKAGLEAHLGGLLTLSKLELHDGQQPPPCLKLLKPHP